VSANLEGVTLARGVPRQDSTAPSSWASSSPKACLNCPMIALLFTSVSQSLSQQVGIHKNPQKSSDPLLLHLQFLPPSTLSQCSHTDVGQLKTGKYLQRAVPAAHTKTFFLDPPTRLLLSPSLTPARQQSSRMCDNAAHHTPQCNHNSHSELET
jgi:hypothetical protein